MAASGRHYKYTDAMNFYDELLTPITGIDGFHYVWGDENDIYLAFRSNQIKQSDPITYDDAGNVIPLSERFNEKNDDIRYMTREQADSDSELFSIKEQLEASKEKLNASSPVCDLTVPVSFSGKRKAAAYVTEQMKKWGYKVDRQNFGLIYFNEKDISKAADYADTNEEKAAMLAVPYVLKRGFIIGEHDNHKKRNKRTITFGAKVQLNGTSGNMAVVVNLNGNHYNVSRIVNPDGSAFVFKSKEAGQEPNQGVRSNASLADSTSPTSKSNYISDLDESQYTSEKNTKKNSEGILLNHGGSSHEI